jgi:hypothetical protein
VGYSRVERGNAAKPWRYLNIGWAMVLETIWANMRPTAKLLHRGF